MGIVLSLKTQTQVGPFIRHKRQGHFCLKNKSAYENVNKSVSPKITLRSYVIKKPCNGHFYPFCTRFLDKIVLANKVLIAWPMRLRVARQYI